VALYPDDLLALVLPASTQPLQIVEAGRLLEKRKTDPTLQPPKTWDPSVVSLLNYPEVVELMNADLTWTQQLGTSVITQQAAVMDAIQSFRRKVHDAGNLKSDDKQTVTVEKETIVIQPADPQVVYVPSYNSQTVVYAPQPGYPPPYVYSPPYPYYYSPAAPFFTGAVFGMTLGFALSWSDHGVYSGDVNINRTNNINVSNVQNRQRNAPRNTNVSSRISANRENVWRPDRTAVSRTQANLGTSANATGKQAAARPSSRDVRSSSAAGSGSAGQTNRTSANAGRTSASSNVGGQRSAGNAQRSLQSTSSAFSKVDRGATAQRYSDRGSQSLRGGRQGAPARGGGGVRGRR
jgi:hypothetical protein